MASVIPFPLHRVGQAPADQISETPSGDTVDDTVVAAPVVVPLPILDRPAVEVAGDQAVGDQAVGVDDLRERIKDLEAGENKPVASSGTTTKENTRAKNIALHQLGVSGRSEAEVRERLVAREISPDVIDEEVSRLLAVGLIDDRALARTLVENLRDRKKLGDGAITQTLRRRKIANDVIIEVLAEGEFDPDIAVYELARDRARSMRHLDSDVAFRRLVGFVQRRGYSGPQVFEAARRALDGTQDVS
jgi:SOS response regulatory protein OraA/RecX